MTVTFTNEQIKWIRSEMSNIEQTKTIRENVLHFIIEKQLFKLIVPEELGGKMLSLPEAIRIFQDASYVDGNFGWLVTVGSGGECLPLTLQKKLPKRSSLLRMLSSREVVSQLERLKLLMEDTSLMANGFTVADHNMPRCLPQRVK